VTVPLLSGLRVLDASIWRPGPYATQLLTDLGADVLKVEPPAGDPSRIYPDLFDQHNGGKRSVVADLKTEEGRALVRDLARDADVFVEGFRPGVADRLGVGADALREVNPDLVYCSVSGFGQDGPYAFVAGHDINYQAMGGTLAPDGGVPISDPLPYADLAGGMAAAFAILAAVHRARAGGGGERIDVSMTDVLATWTGPQSRYAMADADKLYSRPPAYGPFRTNDGWISIGIVSEDHFWRAFCAVLGLEDVEGLTALERSQRGPELRDLMTEAIAGHGRDALVDALQEAGVPAAPVLDRDEMLAHPLFHARGVVAGDGTLRHPVRYAGHQPVVGGEVPSAGQHSGEAWLPR
jgi:crotonobetainyl-CoA:carnitine CoA-transferase CaiB-like acyl-CoA transferase